MPRLRALHLAYSLPYPPRCGYDLRAVSLCKQLQKEMDVTLLTRSFTGAAAPASMDGMALRVLHLPRPTLWERLWKGLRFLPGAFPVLSAGYYFPAMARAIQEELTLRHYDWVVMEGIWLSVYWPLLQKFPARKAVNHYDLEPESLRRQASVLAPGLNKWLLSNAARRMENIEARLVREASINWVTSRREQEALLKKNPSARVFLAPNGVDVQALQPLPPAINSCEILFVGALSFFPNVDGVLFFAREVLPLIQRRRPDVVFRVVGRQPPAEIQALHRPPQIEITGEVPDLEPWYRRAAACVVPLRAGGGTRLKILEAMALGRAVVSTPLGAEGIDAQSGRDLLMAETPPDLAGAISDLLDHPERARQLALQARQLVEEKYAWSSIAESMLKMYRASVS